MAVTPTLKLKACLWCKKHMKAGSGVCVDCLEMQIVRLERSIRVNTPPEAGRDEALRRVQPMVTERLRLVRMLPKEKRSRYKKYNPLASACVSSGSG